MVHESFVSNAWQATDTGTRVYDGFERLTSIGWTTGTGNNQATVASFAYLYNTANERTRTTLADGSYWQYVYDDLGQVSSGKRYSTTGAPIPGQQFEYTFDDIGNRTQAKAGGDASGNNLRTANYTSNLLNMYTGRGSPGSVDIMGYAPLASYPVSITTGGNTVAADFRLLEYYQKKVSWTNTAAARFEQVLVESDPTHAGTEKELWVFLPKDPEAFTHDVDGNLLQDGRWNYGWDGENRLIWMESRTDLPTAMPRQRVEFGYDFMSRRNVKRMYVPIAVAEIPGGPLDEPQTVGSTTAVIDGATASVAGPASDAAPETLPAWAVSAPVGWTQVGLSKYVWDGWNLLAELDATDASVRTFAWGLDLSGSEQGAGGIGGLVLGWTRANGSLGGEVNGSGGNTLRYVFDGSGNVMAAMDDLGRVRAKYEYGPFGETLTSEGDLAADNPVRWSTKYTDGESGLVYYGYRYYNAGTGRWLSRDPIEADNPGQLLAFVLNSPVASVDPFGLATKTCHGLKYTPHTFGVDTPSVPVLLYASIKAQLRLTVEISGKVCRSCCDRKQVEVVDYDLRVGITGAGAVRGTLGLEKSQSVGGANARILVGGTIEGGGKLTGEASLTSDRCHDKWLNGKICVSGTAYLKLTTGVMVTVRAGILRLSVGAEAYGQGEAAVRLCWGCGHGRCQLESADFTAALQVGVHFGLLTRGDLDIAIWQAQASSDIRQYLGRSVDFPLPH